MQVTVGSILGRSLNVTLKNFVSFFVIAIVFQLPSLLVQLFVVPEMSPTVGGLVKSIIEMVCNSLVTAGILYGVFQSLRGGKAEIGKCISVAMSRLLPVFLISLVYGIAVGVGLILLIVPGVIIACMWYVAIPVCVVEKAGVGTSLGRSALLTKGHRLTLFLVFLVFVLIGLAVGLLAIAPLAMAGSVMLAAIAAFAVSITIGLWGSATGGVAYHDLRAAKEGLADQDLAAIFE